MITINILKLTPRPFVQKPEVIEEMVKDNPKLEKTIRANYARSISNLAAWEAANA